MKNNEEFKEDSLSNDVHQSPLEFTLYFNFSSSVVVLFESTSSSVVVSNLETSNIASSCRLNAIRSTDLFSDLRCDSMAFFIFSFRANNCRIAFISVRITSDLIVLHGKRDCKLCVMSTNQRYEQILQCEGPSNHNAFCTILCV